MYPRAVLRVLMIGPVSPIKQDKPVMQSRSTSDQSCKPNSWQSALLLPGGRAPCGQSFDLPEIKGWVGGLSGVRDIVTHSLFIPLVTNNSF